MDYIIYVINNIWSILGVCVSFYAVLKAVEIAEKQIKISKYQAKLGEIQSLLSDIQIGWSNLSEQMNIMNRIEDNFDSLPTKDHKQEAFNDAVKIKETLDLIIDELKEQKERVQIKQKELDSINID